LLYLKKFLFLKLLYNEMYNKPP